MTLYTYVRAQATMHVWTYLKSCSGPYGIIAIGLSDGKLCTNISPLNVRLIIHGQPAAGMACVYNNDST